VPANLIDAALAAYARAIRILDPIRFQVWAERGITMPQVRVLFMLASPATSRPATSPIPSASRRRP